jgi:uncharacterized protein YdiU (UPF0061 family)
LFERHWLDGMRAKLGLFGAEDGDRALAGDLLDWMEARSADFTNTFAALTRGESIGGDAEAEAWHRRLAERRGRRPQSSAEVAGLMRRHNPAVIPRNHLVEAALAAAVAGDPSVMERLLGVLATPYDHDGDVTAFSAPGNDPEPYRTFCGT